MDYLYKIEYRGINAGEGADLEFDPASLTKIYYVLYLLNRYSLQELKTKQLKLTRNVWSTHRKGTRKLRFSDINNSFPVYSLLEDVLQFSCNIATAMIADFAGRDNVNNFITEVLNLQHTSVPAKGLRNISTAAELIRTLQLASGTGLLNDEARTFLLDTMEARRTEWFLRPVLDKYFRVYSKGGTTFTGQKRDLAIIRNRKTGEFGYVVVVDNRDIPLPAHNKLHKLQAKYRKGRLHKHLQNVESEFGEYCKNLLEKELLFSV